jgi:hypothetical protein
LLAVTGGVVREDEKAVERQCRHNAESVNTTGEDERTSGEKTAVATAYARARGAQVVGGDYDLRDSAGGATIATSDQQMISSVCR